MSRVFKAEESVQLNEVLERYANQPAKRQIRVARLLLKGYLYRETHAIQGPKIRSFDWFPQTNSATPEVKALVQSEAKRAGKSVERIRNEVDRTVEHIAAPFSFRIFESLCDLSICMESDFLRCRCVKISANARGCTSTGTPILVPSHRSHLDYLLIGSQCYEHGLVLPYVVAGENLSFFPMGLLLFSRKCGHSLSNVHLKKIIFPTVFERYVRLLIREDSSEFFIEGGRSLNR